MDKDRWLDLNRELYRGRALYGGLNFMFFVFVLLVLFVFPNLLADLPEPAQPIGAIIPLLMCAAFGYGIYIAWFTRVWAWMIPNIIAVLVLFGFPFPPDWLFLITFGANALGIFIVCRADPN